MMTHAQLKHTPLIPSNHAVQQFPLGLVPAGLQIQGHAAVEWTHLAVNSRRVNKMTKHRVVFQFHLFALHLGSGVEV